MAIINFCKFFILFSSIVHVISAPVDSAPPPPPNFNEGDIVGAKAEHYQSGVKKGDVPPHPGVILGGQKPNGNYDVAVMSKKLPYQPPQQDIKDFHPDSSLYGNLALSPPYELPPEKIKPWMSSITHQEEIPMPPEGVAKLKAAMAPHKDWQIPEPAEGSQAPAVPAPVPAPAPKAKEKGKNKKNKKDASAAGKGGSSAPGPSFSRGGAGSSGSAVASQRKGRTSALNRSAKPVPKEKQTVAKSKIHDELRPHAPHAASKAKALKKPAKAPASPKFKAPHVRAAAAHPQAHPHVVAKAPSRSAPPKKQPIKSRAQGKRPHRR